VGLLQQQKIGLDYETLFWDLVRWQDPATRGDVVRRWGRDYSRSDPHPDEQGSGPIKPKQPEEKTA
jgi:hypothetical protein